MALRSGTTAVQVQIGELIRDVTELRSKFDAHELAHVAEARQRDVDRREARRYAITTTIAAVAALVTIIGELLTRLH